MNEKPIGIINVESQTPTGMLGISAHINESIIALKSSRAANILYKRNRPLFDKINSTTRIYSGHLYRLEYKGFRIHTTKAGSKVLKGDNPTRKEIASLTFEKGVLVKQQRRLFKSKKTCF